MARLWGDEFHHGVETQDGYSIVQETRTGVWYFAVLGRNGELTPGGVRADARPPVSLLRHARPARAAEAASESQSERPPISQLSPHAGTVNVAVLLGNFADRTPTYTPAQFQELFFGTLGTGPGNLNDYFQEISYGRLSLSEGPSGIGGWYTASKGHDYYGADGTGRDTNLTEFAREIIQAAYDAGFDFSKYDADGDGYVDAIYIVHQGAGQEHSGASSTDIWYQTRSFPAIALGPVKATACIFIPETDAGTGRIAQIGFAAHEMGHLLGLTDLYDTDGSSEGVGAWSTMGTGNWNYISNDGDTPVHYDAWSKAVLGWLTPVSVTSGYSGEVPAVEENPFALQLLAGSAGATGEYFLLENRQAIRFDSAKGYNGLLIWHVDEITSSNSRECYPGGASCVTQHYRVAVEQADGLYHLEKHQNRADSRDLFQPGQSFDSSSSPNSNLNDGTPSEVTVKVTALASGGIGCEIGALPETVSEPRFSSVGIRGTSRYFRFGRSVTSLGNPVRYKLDWGDGTDSGWLAAEVTDASNTWDKAGSYAVRAYASTANTTIVSRPSSPYPVVISQPSISAGGIVSSASYGSAGVASPGSWVSIFGTGLTPFVISNKTLPLTTDTYGVQVLVNGVPAPLLYVSPTLINAQVPFSAPVGQTVPVVVKTGSLSSEPMLVQVADFTPAFFTLNSSGRGDVIAQHLPGYGTVSQAAPAKPGETVVLYCEGLGQTSPPLQDGQAASGQATLSTPTLTVGGLGATVLYAGAVYGNVGLYQVNAVLPTGLEAGEHELILKIGDKLSPPGVTIRIQP